MVITYTNNLHPDLNILISCCMSNVVITEKLSFDQITEICKMIFTQETFQENKDRIEENKDRIENKDKILFITSQIQDMENCLLTEHSLKYINKNV